MKQKLWLTLVGCIAYCIDKELYKSIDYLREQVRVLVEHQKDPSENVNVVDDPTYAKTLKKLETMMKGGWKAAMPESAQ